MRIDRMLAITVLLLNRDRVSAKELADKFEVSVRTVYRDIDAINQAGIPVVSYPGNQGGFGIMENYKLDRQVFTLDNMLSILSALQGLSNVFENRELDNAIEKISSLVPDDKTEDLNLYLQQVVIDVLPWGYQARQKRNIQKVHNALIAEQLMRFDYRNYESEFTERVVEPMTLMFKGYAWYLFAYCRMREDYRVFRLSRMKNIEILEQRFQRRKADYRDYETWDESASTQVRVKLRFAPGVRARVEDYFPEKDILYEKDGSMVVWTELPEMDWTYSHLLSYGEDMEVLEPESVRKKMREKIKRISDNYKK